MPQDSSFDIVSKVSEQEIDNAVNQTKKTILTRYDLKGSKCQIDLDKKDLKIKLTADDHMKHETLLGILNERLASRNIPLKSLKMGTPEISLDGTYQQEIEFINGISTEQAKEVTKIIRDLGLKVQAQIQNEQIRVTAKSKDDLQTVITALKGKDLSIPLQFTNYR